MLTIQGTVETVTFKNDDTGYTVLRVRRDSDNALVTCVGAMPNLERGETVRLSGELQNHKRFGPQFSVVSYETIRPTSLEGITRLLASGFVTNVGATRAQAIVSTFGPETLEVLDRQPHRLTEVSGIGKKTAAKIADAWQQQTQIRKLMLFLQDYGVSLNMAHKIFRTYGAEAQSRITENPYVLVEDVWGIGFKKADALAQKLGYAHDSYQRIRAGIVFLLTQAAAEGHCFVPESELVDKGATLLEVPSERVACSLDQAAHERLVMRDDDRVYLPPYFYAEERVAQILADMLSRPAAASTDRASLDVWLNAYAARTGWQPDPVQVSACAEALAHRVFVLTGGPGTGKTTTLQVLVSYFREHHLRVTLAAPTGRAAQRMGTLAGYSAQTIHRLLEYRPSTDRHAFGRNASRPVEADVVILDEVSMIDILLMRSLLEAVPPAASIILVGDGNQLPSIGAGSVLADLIAAGRVPHVELKTIFRQAAKSRIVTCAHEIIRGDVPRFSNAKEDDLFFLSSATPEECCATVLDLVCDRLPKRFGFDPVADVQVLSPMHRGPLGTQNLNRLLQERLNPNTRSVLRGEARFAVGDRVMQIRNDYDRSVFNGDIGFVVDIDEENTVAVSFDGNRVGYEPGDLEDLVHAYCISIHKSQGCEFKAVVIPLVTQHFVMLQRNLVYTALTRARTVCVFAGNLRALEIAVRNNQALRRYSWLAQRIVRRCDARAQQMPREGSAREA